MDKNEKNEAFDEEKRELTDAEKRRTELFDKIRMDLEGQGYEMQELTVSILKANTLGILITAIFAAAFGIAYYLMKLPLAEEKDAWKGMVTMILYFASIVVHELIHGVTWGLGLKGGFRENIEFGFIVQAFTPYCTCKTPMKKSRYLIGSMMPCFLLGFVPCIISLVIGNLFLLIFGILGILAGGGDLLICLVILTHKSKGKKEQLYLDHPTKIGLALFER